MKLETTIEMLSSDLPLIRLQQIEIYEDGSGARCLLTVNSGHFSCASYPFYFEDLKVFCLAIARMYKDLKGKARMSLRYERDFIELEMDKLGHVIVHGLIVSNAGEQQLQFHFQTDQTCLASMVKTTESALREMK